MGSAGSTLRVQHLGGARFSIVTRGHEVTVDQPLEDGGNDAGPSPTEIFVASLASCVAYYGRMFLHARALPEQVSVDARWSMERGPARVGTIQIMVEAPGIPSTKLDAFRRAIEHCTVHNTLLAPPAVSFSIAAGGREDAQAS